MQVNDSGISSLAELGPEGKKRGRGEAKMRENE
jgi:hypothetical protein